MKRLLQALGLLLLTPLVVIFTTVCWVAACVGSAFGSEKYNVKVEWR